MNLVSNDYIKQAEEDLTRRKDNGQPYKTHKLTADQRAAAIRRVRKGVETYEQIGGRYGVTRSSIAQLAKSRGIVRRRSSAKYITDEQLQAVLKREVPRLVEQALRKGGLP